MAIPIPLLLGGIQGAFQGLAGISQRQKANKLRQSNYIPPALQEELNIGRTQANASLYPGQDIDQNNLRQGTADSFANLQRSATSSGQLLNAGSKLGGQLMRGQQNIARTGQMFRQGAMDRYRQSLRSKANVQQANQNQFQAAKSALIGSSGQNAYNALTSVLGGAAVADYQKTGKGNQLFNPMSLQNMDLSMFLK